MSFSRFRAALIAALIVCAALAYLIGGFTGFEPRWRSVTDGMTEAQVKEVLGPPDVVRTSGTIGSGGKQIIRWDYQRSFFGRPSLYCVDFDFIGAGGAPAVFRTERMK